jgi:hypothetical protein
LKRPNFFIIGAQRCGTTSLRRYLSEHPRIFIPKQPLEPRYFADDFVTSRSGNLSAAVYLKLFTDAGNHHLTAGDSSPTYLPSMAAIANILRFEPAAKFIVLLRSPMAMVRSLNARFVLDGFEDVADFEEAWGLQAARRRGERIPPFCFEPKHLEYGVFCKLGEQLERLYRQVRHDLILVVYSAGMKARPQTNYERVLSFLDVPSDGRVNFPLFEVSGRHRSPMLNHLLLVVDRAKAGVGLGRLGLGVADAIHRWNRIRETRRALRPEFHAALADFFRDDVTILSNLTGRDLSGWLGRAC